MINCQCRYQLTKEKPCTCGFAKQKEKYRKEQADAAHTQIPKSRGKVTR